MTHKSLFAVAAGFVLAFGLLTQVAVAQTLDQFYTATGELGISVSTPYYGAQTYTAGITGTLTSVSVLVQGDNFTVQIRNVVSGAPGSIILGTGTGTQPANQCTPVCIPISVTPSSTIPQVAGTQYAIVVISNSFSTWVGDDVGLGGYKGGSAFQSSDSGATWSIAGGEPSDLSFQTFVLPSAPKFACVGFQAPFDVPLLLSKKTNRAIPLNVQLFDSNNNLVTPTTLGTAAPPVVNVSYQSVISSAVDDTSLLDALGQSSSGNQFNFDSTTQTWWFHLASTPFTAPGTYTVTVQAGDPSYQVSPTCSGTFVRK
jgi:hypothetical protein